ncbi:MAG: hypothetical protein WA294_19675 [Acidobacteriaceae bacterium]
MARGWESKSVEDQVEEKAQSQPAYPSGVQTEEQRTAQAAKSRERQALELQRERILDERTSNPIRRAALEAALAEIEAKLAAT